MFVEIYWFPWSRCVSLEPMGSLESMDSSESIGSSEPMDSLKSMSSSEYMDFHGIDGFL